MMWWGEKQMVKKKVNSSTALLNKLKALALSESDFKLLLNYFLLLFYKLGGIELKL